jgi:hypothetical protein
MWCDSGGPCVCATHYHDPSYFSEKSKMATRTRSRRHAERPYPSDPGVAGGGLHDPLEDDSPTYDYADDDGMPDRDELIRMLVENYGFKADDLEGASDDLLRAILMSHGNDEVGHPEPKDDDEREEFAEHFRKKFPRHHRAFSKYCAHSDDANSRGGGGGMLASGVSMDTTPSWDAATYKRKFAENETGLRQMGIDSPEKLKAQRERKQVFCGGLPKEAKPGRPLDRKFAAPGASSPYTPSQSTSSLRFSEQRGTVRQQAEKFAESRIKRGDGHYTGLGKRDYERIYMKATEEQRQEFCAT